MPKESVAMLSDSRVSSEVDSHVSEGGYSDSSPVADATKLDYRLVKSTVAQGGSTEIAHWDDFLPPCKTSGDPSSYSLVLLDAHHDQEEFDDVLSLFISSMKSKSTIKGIYRVQNAFTYLSFYSYRCNLAFRMEQDGLSRDAVQVKRVWHGCSSTEACINICQTGFDRFYSRSGLNAFGCGTYFGATARVSHRYATEAVDSNCGTGPCKLMFLAYLAVGSTFVGSSRIYPPPVNPTSRHGMLYDTAVNSMSDPSIHVAFNDAQAYPAYVVSYVGC